VPLLVSLTRKRAIYLALELDRSWTDTLGITEIAVAALTTPIPYLKLASHKGRKRAAHGIALDGTSLKSWAIR